MERPKSFIYNLSVDTAMVVPMRVGWMGGMFDVHVKTDGQSLICRLGNSIMIFKLSGCEGAGVEVGFVSAWSAV